jgi:hypothetical protein
MIFCDILIPSIPTFPLKGGRRQLVNILQVSLSRVGFRKKRSTQSTQAKTTKRKPQTPAFF